MLVAELLLSFAVNGGEDLHMADRGIGELPSMSSLVYCSLSLPVLSTEWPLVSALRLGVLGNDFVIDEQTAWDTSLMFWVFTFLFNIIMMNLLIALLSDQWAEVQEQSRLVYLSNLADVIYEYDVKHEAKQTGNWKRCTQKRNHVSDHSIFIHLVEPQDDEMGRHGAPGTATTGATDPSANVDAIAEQRRKADLSSHKIETIEQKVDLMAGELSAVKGELSAVKGLLQTLVEQQRR